LYLLFKNIYFFFCFSSKKKKINTLVLTNSLLELNTSN
jgi:hypothetical protein